MGDAKLKEGTDGELLLVHERSLTRKVGRGSEADDILDQHVYRLAVHLVTQLNVLFRLSRTHGRSNNALERPAEAARTIIAPLATDGPVALRVHDGFVFLGEKHLKASTQLFPIFTSFMDLLAANGAGGIVIASSVDLRDLREFVHLFAANPAGEDAFARLQAAILAAGVKGITVEPPRVVALGDTVAHERRDPAERAGGDAGDATVGKAASETASTRKRARNAYAAAAQTLGAAEQEIRDGGTISFRQAKRAIQAIVDLLLKDQSTVLALSSLRSHDEYTANHSVNVALLALALANRVGYPRRELADLGLAAMFHDVGKCAVPLEILNKPGNFTPDEWNVVRTHSSEGVLTLVQVRGLQRVPGRMAAAAFEHHMRLDLKGYPQLNVLWKQSLASRIVTIADCYDAMTASRVYRREPISPAVALADMFAQAGTGLDPVLLKLFVTCVGLLPIGTLVLLDTGELAVVVRAAESPDEAARPPVRLIANAQGDPLEPAVDADLRERTASGAFARTIVKIIDHTQHRIDTARYVLD